MDNSWLRVLHIVRPVYHRLSMCQALPPAALVGVHDMRILDDELTCQAPSQFALETSQVPLEDDKGLTHPAGFAPETALRLSRLFGPKC